MKEPLQVIANTTAIVSDGEIRPQVEVGLVLSEPNYRMVESQVVRERVLETVRFCASPSVLRKIAAELIKMADDTDTEFDAAQKE